MHPTLSRMPKKLIIRMLVVGLVLFVGWQIIGPHDWYCHRCGARKTHFFVTWITPSETTQWLTEMGMEPCDHYWVLNSSMLGLADSFAAYDIPLLARGTLVVRFGVEKLPNEEWRYDILQALTDERNQLKWAVLEVIELEGLAAERSAEEWKAWREAFDLIFSVEYDPVTARNKAAELAQAIHKEYPTTQQSTLGKITDELLKR